MAVLPTPFIPQMTTLPTLDGFDVSILVTHTYTYDNTLNRTTIFFVYKFECVVAISFDKQQQIFEESEINDQYKYARNIQ